MEVETSSWSHCSVDSLQPFSCTLLEVFKRKAKDARYSGLPSLTAGSIFSSCQSDTAAAGDSGPVALQCCVRCLLPTPRVSIVLTFYKALAEVSKCVFRHSFPQTLLSLVKQEITSSSDTKKLLAGVNVYVPTGSNDLTYYVAVSGCVDCCSSRELGGGPSIS